MADMTGRLHGIVIDCPDPGALAAFYEKLLGFIRVQDEGAWVVIGDAPDRPGIGFQQVDSLAVPEWPAHSAQLHLDIRVDDLDEAQTLVEGLGARQLKGGGNNFRVFADPAGHPFCLTAF